MDFAFVATIVLAALTLFLAVPIIVIFLEIVAASFLFHEETPAGEPLRRKIAVLVPAHNEGAGLIPTLNDLKAQLLPGDRLLVVADNCSDNTAEIAAAAGAEVVVRSDETKKGKSHALEFGMRHLASDPPEVLLIVDADCRVHRGTVAALVDTCARTGHPAQALDLMLAGGRPSSRQLIATFAWRVKNWVRPLGLRCLGQPCQLMGTGMAFPWDVIPVSIADDLVEDVRLGLDLAAAGRAPVFCPAALVTSEFPSSAIAVDAQRRRWEHGHLRTIVSIVPKMLGLAIAGRNSALLVLALDLLVPPIALLALAVAASWLVCAVGAVVGLSPWLLLLSTVNMAFFFTAILLAWLDFGRDILPLRSVGATALYALSKLGLYRDFAGGRISKQWIRTDRNPDSKA